MYAGRIIEQGTLEDIFRRTLHPYTEGLMNAVAALHRNDTVLETIRGAVPDLLRLPAGCSFSPRCARCGEACAERAPELRSAGAGHEVRCHEAGGKEEA